MLARIHFRRLLAVPCPQAVQALLRLAPATALLLTTDEDGRVTAEEDVPVALVQRGDLLKVGCS